MTFSKRIFSDQLKIIDQKQKILSEQWLSPNLPIIYDELLALRNRVDKEITNQHSNNQKKHYPLGRCRPDKRRVGKQ